MMDGAFIKLDGMIIDNNISNMINVGIKLFVVLDIFSRTILAINGIYILFSQ